MISSSVAPCARFMRAMTSAFLLPRSLLAVTRVKASAFYRNRSCR